MERFLLTLIRLGLFAVPLTALAANDLLSPDIFRPHVAWKAFSFRLLIEVVTGLWLVLLASSPRWRPARSGVLTCFAVFVSITALADLLGHNPELSTWTNLERMDGLIGLLHLLAFALVASSVLVTSRHWGILLGVSLGACTAVCLEAAGQSLGWVDFLRPDGDGRLDARMGHPVPLAIYVQLHLFLLGVVGVRANRGLVRGLCVALAILFAAVLFGTGTRAAWLATIAGIGVAGISGAGGRDRARGRQLALLTTAVCVVLGGGLMLMVWLDPPFLRGLPALGRVRSFTDDAATRLAVWSIAWQGFLDRPLLGWGQYNFGYVFEKFFDPTLYGEGLWWDYPHNLALRRMVDGGILGAAAYAAVHIAALRAVWRSPGGALSTEGKGMLTGLFVSYLAFFCTQPTFVANEVILVGVWAYANSLGDGRRLVPSERAAPPPRRAIAAVVAVLVGAALYWTMERANLRHMRKAHYMQLDLDPSTMVTPRGRMILERALGEASFVLTEAREQFLERAIYLDRTPEAPDDLKEMAERHAVRQMLKEIEREPPTVRAVFSTGYLLNELGRHDEALPHFERALAMSPKRVLVLREMAKALRELGRAPESVEIARRIAALAPHNRNARVTAALCAIRGGDKAAFQEIFSEFRPPPTRKYSVPGQIVDALRAAKWWDQLATIFESIVAMARADMRDGAEIEIEGARAAWFRLAATYGYLGRGRNAEALLRELMTFDPEFAPRAQQLIDDLQAGKPMDLWPGRVGVPLK